MTLGAREPAAAADGTVYNLLQSNGGEPEAGDVMLELTRGEMRGRCGDHDCGEALLLMVHNARI
jgi:hypothetical protein